MQESIKVLVTGASGFIGRKLVRELLSKGYYVMAACRNPKKLNQSEHRNLHLIQYDLEDSIKMIENQIKEIDVICHLAAYIPKEFENYKYAEKCYKINALGTLKLMEYGSRKGVKHFIYYTSGNAYEYSDRPVTEESKMYPSQKATYYLASKLMGELYVEHFRQICILKTTIFRLSSVYGVGMNQNEIICKCINNLNRSIEVEIYNNDVYKTDFVYAEDIVKATCLSIDNSNFGIFNLGSGENYSLGYVVRLIANILNKSESYIKILPIMNSKKVAKGFSALDMTRTKEVIGLVPTPLRVGLIKMIRDIMEHSK